MKKNLESIINVVLGTAGHIDHGKSSLVERLTGIHPDRLPEEKARGLTIDLGFAPLFLRDGKRVGIIDVPGHERLVKNMVAGATGIDAVLLVVAADDGVMPQTREHLSIMELLGIEHGIVVVTKIDAVDREIREIALEDIRGAIAGTFLEKAPLVEVSSVTGEGIDALLATIEEVVRSLSPRDTTGIFRMPIQRVFSSKGFGTVLTGVPLHGTTVPGEVLEVAPLGRKGRVRGIHAYGEPTDLARAGHSTAINLSDVEYREVSRGMVLTRPDYFRGSTLFEARLRYLATNPRPLPHQASIRLHLGTLEALGKVYLLEKKAVEPGEDAYVQFRLEEPAVAAPGDRFILRLHSPLVTVGGGEILDQSRWRLKMGKARVLDLLRAKEGALGDREAWLAQVADGWGYEAFSEKDLALRVGWTLEETRERLEAVLSRGGILRSGRAGYLLSRARIDEARAETLRAAEEHFRKNPRTLFLDKLQLRRSLGAEDQFLDDLLAALAGEGLLSLETGGRLRFRDHGPRLGPEDEKARKAILECLEGALFAPPSAAEIATNAGVPPRRVEEMLRLLDEEGEARELAEGIHFHRSALEEARRRIGEHIAQKGPMTAADARNVLGSSRKFVIPILEELDREGFTVRKGDFRDLKQPGP